MLENCRFSCQSCLSNVELHAMCRVGGRQGGFRRRGFGRNGFNGGFSFGGSFGDVFDRWNRDALSVQEEDNGMSFFMAESKSMPASPNT